MRRFICLLLLLVVGCCDQGANIKGTIESKLIPGAQPQERRLRIATDGGTVMICVHPDIWERAKIGALWDNGCLVVEASPGLEKPK